MFTLLNPWGYECFATHTYKVSEFYHIYYSWAGLFFRFKLILYTEHLKIQDDSDDIIRNKALENGVLVLSGTVFLPNRRKIAYSVLAEAEVNEALKWRPFWKQEPLSALSYRSWRRINYTTHWYRKRWSEERSRSSLGCEQKVVDKDFNGFKRGSLSTNALNAL